MPRRLLPGERPPAWWAQKRADAAVMGTGDLVWEMTRLLNVQNTALAGVYRDELNSRIPVPRTSKDRT